MKKADIQSKEDLNLLVRQFYRKLLDDGVMSPFFLEAASIDFDNHFDTLVVFWQQVLFNTGGYSKNMMAPHIRLNNKMKIEHVHFNRWLGFFNETVDELFCGEMANLAKQKAKELAVLMEIKIRASEN